MYSLLSLLNSTLKKFVSHAAKPFLTELFTKELFYGRRYIIST